MSYLEDLKKKAQNAYNVAQNVGQTVSNVYNAAKQGVQNVYNAATGNTQKPAAPTQNVQNTQPSAATIPEQNQQQTDWAAEYDKVMQSNPANTSAQGVQAAQPVTSPAAQTALGSGASQWQAELDKVMSQIMNQGKFEYNMNGDAMYQQYADIYQNQANLGMQNAMAQAAAMTGGYGSSYGQMVGQQAYAQQMQGLNEIGMQLYDRAYAQDQAERDRLLEQYSMLADREALEYNREYQQSRDAAADSQWQQSFDYQKEQDKLAQSNYEKELAYQQSRDEVADTQWRAELDRMLANDQITQQQWQAEMDRLTANDALAKEQWQQSFDYNKYLDELNQSNYEKELAYQQGRDQITDSQWEKQFASSEQQRAEDNAYRDKALEYQKEQDRLAQQNWQAEMDRALANDAIANSQWKAELDRMLANDQITREQWQAEMDRALANDALDKEQWQQSFDYNKYLDEIDQENFNKQFEYQQGRDQVADSQWKAELDRMLANDEITREQWQAEYDRAIANDAADNKYRDDALKQDQKQFDASMNWQREEYDKLYGENGYYTKQNAADNKYRDEVFAYQKTQDEQAQKNWQAQFDREGKLQDLAIDQSKTTTKYEGNGDYKGKEVPKQLANVTGLTTTNTKFFDENGNFKKAAVVRDNDDGSITYRIGDKEVSVAAGVNPYTNTSNPDTKNGVMSNGYQPDNIAGEKLQKTGTKDFINGVQQNVWKTPDGTEWIWDGTLNKYRLYGDTQKKTTNTQLALPAHKVQLTG